jgi:hypothetical protein
MNIKKIISSIGVGAGAIILGLGIQYAVAAWSPAPASPPNNNVAAPINVSGGGENGTAVYSQVKTGLLTLNSLAVKYLNVASGTPGRGNVLASDSSGNAYWVATSSLGFNGGGVGPAGPPGTIDMSSGGTPGNYWFQIGTMLVEGGISYPGGNFNHTSCCTNITFSKPFSTIVSLQLTPLNSTTYSGSSKQIHPEMQVMAYNVTTTSFTPDTISNDGFSWLAIGTKN